MKIYIDTEFNGWGGELISMALVADNAEFYEVLELPLEIDLWVDNNVVPYLNKDFITYTEFQTELRKFLDMYSEIEIIADYPDDIAYLCRALITGPGMTIRTIDKITFTLDYNTGSGQSKIPHNALEDARAIKESADELQM